MASSFADYVMRMLRENGETGIDELLEWIRADIVMMAKRGQIDMEGDPAFPDSFTVQLSETGRLYMDAVEFLEGDDEEG